MPSVSVPPLLSLRHAFGPMLLAAALACSQNPKTGTGTGPSGSGSNALTVTLDKTSAALTAVQGGPSPATTVKATYTGAGLVVGIPAGANAASWLTVTPVTLSTGVATYSLQVNSTSGSLGTVTTTLRFVTAQSDGSGAVYVDLPVSLTLTATDVEGAAPAIPPAADAKLLPLTPAQEALAREASLDRVLAAVPQP